MTIQLPDWEIDVPYVVDDVVYVQNEQPNFIDKIYRCTFAHTSVSFATDFGNARWEEIVVRGVKGDQGDKGEKGDTGATGAAGAQGSQGPNGSDGIFSEIASQAEAEAGVDNTKGMTPIRVKNAIDAQVGNLRDTLFPALANTVAANTTNISLLANKVSQLEATSQVSRASGSQRLLNDQGSAVAILGSDAPGNSGAGNKLQLNPVGATSANVIVEIFRKDDAEQRFVRVELELHFISGTWYLGTKNIITLIGEDSGVDFEVSQDGDNVAQISYTSDNMIGGNYDSASYLRFIIEEIPATLGF